MTPADLLKNLRQRGVELSADGCQLTIRAQKGVLTDSDRAHLTHYKAALLQLLQPGVDGGVPGIAAPADRFTPFPLTDIQQAYWVGRGAALELGNVGCHAYREFERTTVDLPRLEQAWQRVIQRHDMLRCVITAEGQQHVLEAVPPYPIVTTDLRGRADAAEVLAAIRHDMSHHVFMPDQWPLFNIRATLLDARVRVHVGLDLLIADAASMLLLFKEWGQFYEQPDWEPEPLTVTFRDYVLAQVAARHTDAFARAQAYWRARLPSLPTAPELPLAKAPASIEKPRFVRRTTRLDPPHWQQLRQWARQSGLTPSGLLCAVYADILAAWSRSSRFLMTLTLFQSHVAFRGVVGDFTSTILLEADASPPTFQGRARRLQERLAEALDHTAVSGIQVLRELSRLHKGAVPAVPVVFTSALGHHNAPGDQTLPIAWLGETVFTITQTPQVWIDHHVVEDGGGLILSWDVVEDLFPAGMIDAMFEAHGRLLGALASDAQAWHQPVAALVPAAQGGRRRRVNATTAPVPQALLHELFAAQATQRPGHTAVADPRRHMCYAELDQLSNGVARRLRALGAQPNRLVAVVMEKGWEQVVAVLGILKAGAAYLPIDPALPFERRCYLLENGEVEIALTQSWLAVDWPARVQRLAVDLEAPSAAGLASVQGLSDLAYVIYTSGSTGAPKGVMIEHRAAANTIVDINQRYGVGPDDRLLALSSLSFDLSVYDIFGVLAAGATIVLPGHGTERDPEHWLELLHREGVTVWNSVPALMGMAVAYGRPLGATLRLVMLSGDWIPLALPEQIWALAPQAKVQSLGGATEASIWSIDYPIECIQSGWSSIPYGRPLANQSFQVLNDRLEPCPEWVAGQLFIGGLGLARGYWRDALKTAERFIQHPLTEERLYATGDLGRYLPDGTIEFLGREDFQVKVQGHRIELGEIEAVLSSHPRVQAAVVTARGEPRGDKRLVAYMVPEPTRTSDPVPDAFEPLPEAGVILDPLERRVFSLARRGLRDQPAATPLRLSRAWIAPDTYGRRQTDRRFQATPIGFDQFQQWLSCLAALASEGSVLPRYRYPSAGSLYPVQVYLHLQPGRVEGVPAGTYYYHPEQHSLVPLVPDGVIDRSVHATVNQPVFDTAAFSLFLVAQLAAMQPLYGQRAHEFCLLEAGYMGQLLMTEAPLAGLGLCPIGTLDFGQLRSLFALDESHELVHSFVGGIPAAELPMATADIASAEPGVGLIADVRAFLSAKLPAYMVPSAFVQLQALPLTANGKVDRAALPEPQADLVWTSAAPQTDLERAIADLVRAVVGVDTVGLHDNFFDIGATSLHLVRLHRDIGHALERDFAVVELFRRPTIAQMAAFLSQQDDQPSSVQQGQSRGAARRTARQRSEQRRT
jgi:amino acid adenylation domain-containing protein